jgi:U3 small nucleolar RNA-associated protein MPP10
MTKKQAEHCLDHLDHFVQLLSRPEDASARILWKNPSETTTDDGVVASPSALLRNACVSLFQEIETLGRKYNELANLPTQPNGPALLPSSLSGLKKLYIGGGNDTVGDEDDVAVIDAETLWGQVDLQNSALHKLLKRSLKQLDRAEVSNVRLLDNLDDDKDVDTESPQDRANDESDDSEIGDGNSDESAGSGDDDEETKRIRDRMKRSMNDMDEDENSSDEEDSESDGASETEKVNSKSVGSDVDDDPDAVKLHDGFFNLQEMEAFADEEEEYLPAEAFGPLCPDEQEDKSKRTNKSFHQKQRDGDLEDDSASELDDTEADDLLFRKEETSARKRKYRADDEIEALHSLYKTQTDTDGDDEDEDSEMNVINMTAADIFRKPNRKYLEKWKSKAQIDNQDDDSWNGFDFDRNDKNTGWNDSEGNDIDDESDHSPSDARTEYPDERDEDVPMKGDKPNRAQAKAPTMQAAKILAQTEQLERELLAEKPWQMKGETGSTSRPLNSLLDTTPEFEVASKMAPIITVERTANLEEIIKKRILAEDWDDVVPRELPDIGWNRKRGDLPEVSQEKSKLGLGELYEREYLKKAVGHDVEAAAKQTEEEKAKTQMKALFANLCSKLDALSNYHFAPRPIANDVAEVRPITVPAIAMEEVLPIHFSDARGVAPEEVYGAKRGREGVLRDESELNQQERKRIRGSKKAVRRKARKEKLADEKLISRLQPGIGLNNPYEKRKIREELSMARAAGRFTTGIEDKNDGYGASGTFFQRMQHEAQQAIMNEATSDVEKKTGPRVSSKSSSFKL